MAITGVMISTPTKSLEVLLSILPVDLYTEQEAMATVIRLKNVECWNDNVSGHSSIIQSRKDQIPVDAYRRAHHDIPLTKILPWLFHKDQTGKVNNHSMPMTSRSTQMDQKLQKVQA